jgi:hypothetical protein
MKLSFPCADCIDFQVKFSQKSSHTAETLGEIRLKPVKNIFEGISKNSKIKACDRGKSGVY